MKMTKKLFSLMLVLAVVFMLAIPASAASPELREQMVQRFPTLSQGSSGDYVGALQCFLSHHTSSKNAMVSAGGIDEDFGPGTSNAVRLFQAYGNASFMDMTVDGIVGDATWLCISYELNDDTADNTIKYGTHSVWKYVSGCIHYLTNENNLNNSTYFHTIVVN